MGHKQTPSLDILEGRKTFTISIPNRDELRLSGMFIPKEVLQTGYTAMVGKELPVGGVTMKVKSVRITEETIQVEVEQP